MRRFGCDSNGLDSIDLTNNINLEFLQVGNNLFTRLDISNNPLLEYIEIRLCTELEEICVWELPFPPPGVVLSAYGVNLNNINIHICTTDISDFEVPPEEEFIIYPNPSSGTFTVLGNSIVRLDILCYSGELIVSESGKSLIDMTGFSSGIYLVRIYTDSGAYIRKVLLE